MCQARLLRALLGMRMLAATPRAEAAHALRRRLRHVQQVSSSSITTTTTTTKVAAVVVL
jgi:hypothetical protein